mmetsp:Transcript_4655/g.14069  ORF Transcript_4655/g.14069 Transcript_4655/m.14069 type:complete len:134 (+) Transcript_4655:236-637(+)
MLKLDETGTGIAFRATLQRNERLGAIPSAVLAAEPAASTDTDVREVRRAVMLCGPHTAHGRWWGQMDGDHCSLDVLFSKQGKRVSFAHTSQLFQRHSGSQLHTVFPGELLKVFCAITSRPFTSHVGTEADAVL